MNKTNFSPVTIGIILLLTTGCHVISKDIRQQVKPDLTFQEILSAPEKNKGQIVILSGVIIETTNTKEGTMLKVLQRPTGFRGAPKDTDTTEGRFIAIDDRYLDSAVYTKDREVTVAGEIQGKRELQEGQIQYAYPVIHVKELYLWPVIKETHPHYYDGFYSPLWWGHPHYIIVRQKCDKK